MWDLPGPGLKPVSPALAGGFLTTAPTGKPAYTILKTGPRTWLQLNKQCLNFVNVLGIFVASVRNPAVSAQAERDFIDLETRKSVIRSNVKPANSSSGMLSPLPPLSPSSGKKQKQKQYKTKPKS